MLLYLALEAVKFLTYKGTAVIGANQDHGKFAVQGIGLHDYKGTAPSRTNDLPRPVSQNEELLHTQIA